MIEDTKTPSTDNTVNGLSQGEQVWLSKWFTILQKNQEKQIEILGKINGSLTFIVVIIIIGILITLFKGCTGL